MVIMRLALEEALLQKIQDGEGSFYEMMILAQEYNTSFKKVDKIIKKYMRNNNVVRIGYKLVIKDKLK